MGLLENAGFNLLVIKDSVGFEQPESFHSEKLTCSIEH